VINFTVHLPPAWHGNHLPILTSWHWCIWTSSHPSQMPTHLFLLVCSCFPPPLSVYSDNFRVTESAYKGMHTIEGEHGKVIFFLLKITTRNHLCSLQKEQKRWPSKRESVRGPMRQPSPGLTFNKDSYSYTIQLQTHWLITIHTGHIWKATKVYSKAPNYNPPTPPPTLGPSNSAPHWDPFSTHTSTC
jgi:hypothetical protein